MIANTGTLADHLVLSKTAKGQREIERREFGLGLALRRVLILVDGKRTCGEFSGTLGESIEATQALARLIDEGFVAPVQASAAPAVSPRAALMLLLKSSLGTHAAKVLPIIERCVDEPEALDAALASAAKLIRLTIDERKADSVLANGRAFLQRCR